jgi:hypothetical protein
MRFSAWRRNLEGGLDDWVRVDAPSEFEYQLGDLTVRPVNTAGHQSDDCLQTQREFPWTTS